MYCGGKEMKKKLLCLLCALLMSVSLLTGCQGQTGKAPDDKTITLKYWTHQETPWNISNDKLIAAFEEEYPDIRVEVEAYPYDDFEQKVQTSLLSKSGGADIYELWGGWALEFAPTGVFDAVPDDLISDLLNDCYEPVLGAFKYNDSYYGVPMEFNAEYGGMLVNKPYFEEHNLSYPNTWDEMIDLATEHSVSKGDIFDMRGFDFISFDSLPYTWLSMILSSGGTYMEGDTFNFDSPIAKDTLQKLVDYVKVNKVTNIEGLSGSDIENFHWLFLDQALMVPRGIWSIPVGEEEYGISYGKEFSYVPMPFYGPEKRWAAETGWGLAVNSGSENTDAAWKFVSFCLRPDNLLQLNVDRGMIPPRKSVAHDPAYVEAVPYAKPILDVLDGASFVGPINTDVLKESICNMFADIIQNNTPIDTAVAKLNQDIQ
jgi:multiple sugar transport system substrate-binding protein